MAVYLTQKELAELVGRTDRQIRNINSTMDSEKPLLVKVENGKYDASLFVQRWCEMQVSKVTEGMEDLDAVKARHEIVKTEKTQLEVAKMRRDLLEFRDVRKAWGDIANTVMNGLLNIPGQIAPMIRGMDSVETIGAIIDGEIRRALEGISNTPLPSYAMDIAEDEKEEEE